MRWYKIEEYKRQLKFVISNIKNQHVDVPFAVNPFINFTLLQDYTLQKEFTSLIQSYDKICSPKTDLEFIKAKILLAVCFRYIMFDKKSDWLGEFNPKFMDLLNKTKSVYLSCKQFLEEHPLNIPPKMEKIFHSEVETNNHKIKEIIIYFDFLEKNFIQEQVKTDLSVNKRLQDFRTNDTFNPYDIYVKIEFAEELLEKYQVILCEHVPDHIDLSWESMSTGELAFLTLFSRFFLFFNMVEKIERFKYMRPTNVKTLFIMIDEGETSFHPQWQKKYFFFLLQFLQNLFSKYKIQLILTSNSPFIVSDFPKSNVIFLKKESGKSIACDSLNEIKHTLGANIHTLLTDSFFIQDGLMSDFSKAKINQAIEKLVAGSPINKNEMEEIRCLISNIGEPVIRNKMMELYKQFEEINLDKELKIKTGEIETLKSQVKDLEQRIQKIETTKKRKKK